MVRDSKWITQFCLPPNHEAYLQFCFPDSGHHHSLADTLRATNDILSLSVHICQIIRNDNRPFSSILCCFHSRNRGLFARASVTHVHHLIECNSAVLPTRLKKANDKVQRRLTKNLLVYRKCLYTGRLKMISGLEFRRPQTHNVVLCTSGFSSLI